MQLWDIGDAAVRPGALLRIGCRQRFVHDAADGPYAAPALGAAAKTAVDLTRRPRRGLPVGKRRAHVVVGQHIAGADDHLRNDHCRKDVPKDLLTGLGNLVTHATVGSLMPARNDFNQKSLLFSYSKLLHGFAHLP